MAITSCHRVIIPSTLCSASRVSFIELSLDIHIYPRLLSISSHCLSALRVALVLGCSVLLLPFFGKNPLVICYPLTSIHNQVTSLLARKHIQPLYNIQFQSSQMRPSPNFNLDLLIPAAPVNGQRSTHIIDQSVVASRQLPSFISGKEQSSQKASVFVLLSLSVFN